MSFTEFDLHPDLLDGIEALNYTTATPIQAQAIPIILEGRDLIGIAQTGTGKTAAFTLPIMSEILDSAPVHATQALIIVPTRELAQQIEKVVEAYAYFTGISCCAIYGGGDGKDFNREKNAITQGADLLIATPGRLIAHLKMGYVDFSKLRFLVLDEADRMLDMGFQPDLLKIIEQISKERQTLLFSATMPPKVMRFAQGLLRDPEKISIQLSKPAEGVDQRVFVLSETQKNQLIYDLLKDRRGQRIIVFCSSKLSVAALYRHLKSRNLAIRQISSDLEQVEREQVMLDFRNRVTDILVATDVLSRGIDVDGIDLVINYDVPRDAEDYVHRIGRTARAGEKGEAFTLVTPRDQVRFRRIEHLIGRSLPKEYLTEEKEKPAPKQRGEATRGAEGEDKRPARNKRRKGPKTSHAGETRPEAPKVEASGTPPNSDPGAAQRKKRRKKRRKPASQNGVAPPTA